MQQEILLRNLTKPKEADLTSDIDWLCNSLGFTAGRDIERMSSRIVQSLLRCVVSDGCASTESIAEDINIARQRVNYHIRSLTNSGFLYREKKLIFLREGSVKSAVEEMRKDANRIFDKLSMIGEEIDSALGLRNR